MADSQENVVEIEEIIRSVEETTSELGNRYIPDLEITTGDTETEGFSSQDILRALYMDEDGDAWLFTELYRGCFVHDHADGRWYEWNGNFWQEDLTNRVTAAVEELIDVYVEEASRQASQRLHFERQGQVDRASRCEARENALLKRIRVLHTARRKNSILKLASADWSRVGRTSIALTGEEWDRHPWLLGCKNGVVDLRTVEFRPGRPGDYIKTVTSTEWLGINTPAPAWEDFINGIFDDDELVQYVHRLFGYAITGSTTEHIYPILWGRGRNGKSTLLETLREVLGNLAGPIEAEMLLDQGRNRRSGGPTSDIMWLRGKRTVWASETEEGRRLNAGKLKWLTGGDTLTGRAPYGKRQVSFKPSHTVFLLTNSKPHASASDYALWHRLHLIPFNLSFIENPTPDSNERRANPNLFEELKDEASGILSWVVRGCLAWQQEGLNPPDSVRIATEHYRQDMDLIGRFIHERCMQDNEEQTRASHLYDAYKEWCEDNGLSALSNPKFAERILERFERDDTQRHRFYLGIALR